MSEPGPTPAFTFEVTVGPDLIDAQGHVNHKVYVAWAEEAGIRHWQTAAPPEMQARAVWVAARLEIDFLRETLLGETVRVETWLGTPAGARFDRHVRIVGADGAEKARAKTTWVLLDVEKRRPVRIPAEFVELFGRG